MEIFPITSQKMMMIGKIWGCLVSTGIVWYEVQQSLSRLLNKTQQNSNGDNSLEGLDIDWHLANAEMGFDNFVTPIQNDQPTYAYA